ncbi:MAG: gamma-glutamyltransferase family protein [Nitrospinota bacterium]
MAFRHRTPDGREYIAHRPQLMGQGAMVASGHHLATQAALRILERGGNAIDAGVTAGICLNVLQTDMTSFLGVAPIIIYLARERKVVTISGLGRWPRAASVEWFREHCGGEIPPGVRRTVTPAAADAWLTALERYGTKSFAEVAEDAIVLAERGFPMHHFMHEHIAASYENYHRFEDNRPIYFPNGKLTPVGELVYHKDMAETFKRMVRAEEKEKGRGRSAGIRAARDEVYKGETARRMVDYIRAHGGLLSTQDLADFHVQVEEPVSTAYRGFEVYACGPWCQGPVVPATLNLLEQFDLEGLGHNSPDYLHTLLSALNLSFADRHRCYGDPEFVRVPIAGLLSKAYAAERAKLIDPGRAFAEMAPHGDPWAEQGEAPAWGEGGEAPVRERVGASEPQQDTSYCTAVDGQGNAFSATPSDASSDTPIVPGVGASVSSRGSQSWLEEGHPSAVAPWKRPRLTPSPALALKEGRFYMTFGTPGGDLQPQAMLQVFLNHAVFGMMPQMAVEVARAGTYNFPNSFWPHEYAPGRALAEERLLGAAGGPLRERGYKMEAWKDYHWRAGSVCCIVKDPKTGFLLAGADPRRESYAAGW